MSGLALWSCHSACPTFASVCVRVCERDRVHVWVSVCVCQCEEEKERESLLKWYVMALACVRAVTEFANLRLFLLCQRQRRIPANGG